MSPVPIVIHAFSSLSAVYLATANNTATATLPSAIQNTPNTSSFVALPDESGLKGSGDASSSEGGRMARLSAHTLNLIEWRWRIKSVTQEME